MKLRSALHDFARPSILAAWVAILVAAAGTGRAQIPGGQTFWTAGTGNWLDDDNWSLGYPGGGFTPIIDNGGTAQLFATDIFLEGHKVLLGHTDSNSVGTLQVLEGATFGVQDRVDRDILVGEKGTGTLYVAQLSLVTGRSIFAGAEAGSTGTVTLDTGRINITEELHIGQAGQGTLSVLNASEIISRQGVIGFAAGGTGVATITSGVWNSGLGMFVGAYGTGTLNIPLGGTVLSDNAFLGRHTNGHGTANVGGGGWNTAGNFVVGAESSGTLNISNGGSVTAEWGFVGDSAGAAGTVNIAAGSWGITNFLYIGNNGQGTVTLTNGASLTAAGGVEVGSSSGAAGTLNLNGGVLGTGVITKGGGSASVNFNGGTLSVPASVVSSLLFFGFSPGDLTLGGGGGTIEVQGTAFAETSDQIGGAGGLAKTGTGTLLLQGASTFTGGTTVAQGLLAIANNAALGTGNVALGTAELRASTNVTLAGDLSSGIQLISVQGNQTGTFSAAAGQTLTLAPLDFLLTAGSTMRLGSSGAAGTVLFAPTGAVDLPVDVAITVDHGTLRAGNGKLEFMTAIADSTSVASGATLDFDNHLNAAGGISTLLGAGTVATGNLPGRTLQVGDGSFSGVISGAGSLEKINPGILTLSGSNTFTGGTTISSGTLVVDGIIGDVLVAAGGILGGEGSVGALTLEGGSLAPGNSPGTLFASELFWSDGSIEFELGPTPAQSDFINVAGQLFGNGGPYLFDFVDNGAAVGTTYDLIQFGSQSIAIGDFGVTGGNGFAGTFNYANGDTLQFTVTTVPEPSTVALALGALVLLLVLRRRAA